MKRLTLNDVVYYIFAPLFTIFLHVHFFVADVYDATIVVRRPLKNAFWYLLRLIGKGFLFFVSDSIVAQFRVRN